MFLTSQNYLQEFQSLLQTGSRVSLAVAFWGQGAQDLLEKAWGGESLRILCNLGTGGTNPRVIRDLLALSCDRPGLEVLTLDNLHAKVAIGEQTAIVGSANISSNGLGFEDTECVGWQEAGLLISDNSLRLQMQAWFDDLWMHGEEITEEKLKIAENLWMKNRGSRPLSAKKLVEASAASLKNRDIHLAIFRLDASDQARVEASLANKEARRSDSPELLNVKLDFFEDWPDDSEEPLPRDVPILAMRYGPTKRVTRLGAWTRVPQLDRIFLSSVTSEQVSLVMLGKLDSVVGMSLSAEDSKVFARRLKPWIDEIYNGQDPETARCLSLDEFLDWEERIASGDRDLKSSAQASLAMLTPDY
ncbi:phospholipase D family protein [Pseudomonas sp. KU26590]|uniref:phospholipase D family protein n=1 Tax=Pseudomonas sp. KU26590 TaxID=2991051 RepID=UPI00223D6D04|nr:phospholipase D family protein [Pseudomonas sp. KU26590]UZJ58946.1 phospholipase D family protein [Pseudomonas sp. KU26590]